MASCTSMSLVAVSHRHHVKYRRGQMLAYSVVALTILVGFASLAVDFGRVVLCRGQLMHAAEASARAAASSLKSGVSNAKADAVAVAAKNQCDGQPIVLNSSEDIEIGFWDEEARTFTPLAGSALSSANAVRVTVRRTSSRGNAIPLQFAPVIGKDTCDITATATVMAQRSASPSNFAGIDSVDFSSLGVLARVNGDIASNGNIRVGVPLGLLVGVNGDARSYAGTVSKGSLAYISGSKSPLSEELYFPDVEIPQGNDNAQIAGYLDSDGDFNALINAVIPGGTYVVRDLNFVAGLNVRLEGAATFYVTGNFNIAVGANLLGNPVYSPSNLKIRVAEGGNVNFLANLLTPLYMDIYAPNSSVNIAVAVNHFHGRLIAKRLNIALPVLGQFTIDNSLPPPDEGQSHVYLVD